MKVYLISQEETTGYDTYDSMVVYAESEEEARDIHPYYHSSYEQPDENIEELWTLNKKAIKVEYLGEAKQGSKEGIICSSFNAG